MSIMFYTGFYVNLLCIVISGQINFHKIQLKEQRLQLHFLTPVRGRAVNFVVHLTPRNCDLSMSPVVGLRNVLL